jgi:nucleoid-associated protein YgaU
MGIYSFLRDSGEKLSQFEENREAAIRAHLNSLGLPEEKLTIETRHDQVRLSGAIDSQEAKEKTILAAGNISGVTIVDDAIIVQEGEEESLFYTVREGDTLSKIAREHYGDAMKYPQIFEANRPLLKGPDQIQPGQVLRLPPRSR